MADLNIGNSTANVIVNAKHNGAVNPQINNTYDLGTSTLRWKNIYGNLKGNALTVGQGNNPNIAQDANDLILNTPSKLTFYSFNINKLANIPSGGSNWGYLTVGSYGGNYSYQTFVDGYNGTTWTRILSAGTWGAWKTTLDSNNYTNYTVTKTGLGASGTWEISISGNASSASKVNNKLTVGSKTYDGSAAVTISASDLGLASAMLFLGTTTTAITDGATTNPVVLGGSNKTVTAGNVVLYGSKEFVWTGSAWEELGNEGSYKIVQAAVADPSASGTSNTFIATISQDTNGKITATKKTVAVTNSAPTLAWSTTSTIGTVAGTNLQVKMPANPNTDTKVTQTAINAADYTNWRPLVWGSSNSVTEGFTPSTVTDEVYTAQTLSCQPATGTIRATTFKGNLSGNATSATYTTQLLGVNGSNTPYDAIEGNLIRAVWNVEGDSRWYLKAGTYNCRVNYADSTDTATISRSLGSDDTMKVYAHHSNEVNFGGTNNLNAIYFGYRAIDSKPIPSKFVFGGEGTAELVAAKFTGTLNGNAATATNSDTLDGYHHDAFLKRAGDTMTGTLSFSNNVGIHGLMAGGSDYWSLVGTGADDAGVLQLEIGDNATTDYFDIAFHDWSGKDIRAIRFGGSSIHSYVPFYGAVWNDYAEYRETHHEIEPGRCVIEVGDGSLTLAFGRLQPGANIVSDTFGFAIGETEINKTPLAVSGRVLAYPNEPRESYHPGDPVCSGPNGTISRMTREEVREYPDRIVGTVSEIPDYETWGTGNVEVNGRIWIKVK